VLAIASGEITATNWESSSLVKSLNLTSMQLGAVALIMDVSQNGLEFTPGKVEALLVGQGIPASKAKTSANLIDL
jgi:hypothetical protein